MLFACGAATAGSFELTPADHAKAVAQQTNQAIAAVDRQANALPNLQAEVDEPLQLRRLYLTIAGRIPTLAEQAAWQRKPASTRFNDTAFDFLHSEAWVHRRTLWWEDQLRVTSELPRRARGEPYRVWLRNAVANGDSYQDIVFNLVGSSGHYYKEGNGAVGYYLRDTGMPLDNLAIGMQVFLGRVFPARNVTIIPYNDWTQKQFYELAAFSHNAAQYARVNPREVFNRKDRGAWEKT